MNLAYKQIAFLEKALGEYYKANFYAFVKDWFEEWKGVPFKRHYSAEYICEHLQLAYEGHTERLLLSLPRGLGKTIYTSQAFPVWALLNDPLERIGVFSRALTDDAQMWHEASIELLKSARTLKYYPEEKYRLAIENKRILRLNAGGYRKMGSCLASSVGSDMTLAIIDDPADQEHDRSHAKQSRLENFFTKSLLRAVRTVDYTEDEEYLSQLTKDQRGEYELTKILEDHANQSKMPTKKPRIILTMQRLHVNDPIAMFLNINHEMEKAGIESSFKYIKIPAIHEERTVYSFPISGQEYTAEAGEYTLSSTLTKEKIDKAKIEMSHESFQAQMQQNPIIGSNTLMQSSYFGYYSQEDLLSAKMFKFFMTCDTANKTGTANDYSVMCCWGWNGQNLFLLDMVRGKWEILDLTKKFNSFYEKWRYGLKQGTYLGKIIIEDKASGTQLYQWASTFLPISLLTAEQRTTDKYSRYVTVGSFIEQGRVKIPSFNVNIDGVLDVKDEITTPFLNEVTSFSRDDTHKHDDICDCLFDACKEVYAKIIKTDSLAGPRILF